ncbi:RNA binding protein, heterogenous nuclear RNP-K like protein [Actinomortierella ambigua]|uniref:RNA binding protein, heterogenous nuclear RNP-K like protein n=1 Tax=Actinomortierella ambigua TaxID=1343610 RepID=A0A9P6QIS3_9FUNG|nr:RNA binding protein, heterogenous nuclear RNP-K like protein [Actinomortierella ambigua]
MTQTSNTPSTTTSSSSASIKTPAFSAFGNFSTNDSSVRFSKMSSLQPTTTTTSKDAGVPATQATASDAIGHDHHDDVVMMEGGAPDAAAPLTLRALVSTKEAGVIIGKAGKNVAELRDLTGVKAGVSKVVQGVHDRVLTVTGTIEGVAKAFSLIAQTMLDNPITSSPPSTPQNPHRPATQTSAIRLLISHNLMGTIIGRQGAKIKHIQDASGARMVASKDMLPQSTERVVEIQGTVDAIRIAIYEIGKCLVEDWERGVGTVLYNPSAPRAAGAGGAAYTTTPLQQGGASSGTRSSGNSSSSGGYASRTGNGSDFTRPRPEAFSNNASQDIRTQEISIPADMVGCIIGKGGSKISEIRRLSGSRISIAKTPHDETGERMFTIVGTMEANEKALYLLYGQLEVEKDKRLSQTGEHIEEDEE